MFPAPSENIILFDKSGARPFTLDPIIVLSLPAVTPHPVSSPIMVFLRPEIKLSPASAPIATLLLPLWFSLKALLPIATLLLRMNCIV